MSEKKRGVETQSEIVVSGLKSIAEKAVEENDVAELKKCFDKATHEVGELAGVFDAMVRVMAMDTKGPRLLGDHNNVAVAAMKEVSLAAIDLAKAFAGKGGK